MIVRAILARAVRFAIDGLEGAAHEGARESLELRLAESDRLLSVVEGVEAYAVLGAKIGESLLGAARRVVAERDAAIARAEKAEAQLGACGAAVIGAGSPPLERGSYAWSAAYADIVDLHSNVARSDKAVSSARSERDALAAELAAIRAATGEEPSDFDLMRTAERAIANASMTSGLNAPRRALYNLGRTAALGEVALMREEMATLRARVAELEAAPQGQPVATDEELRAIGEEAYESDPGLGTIPSRAMAYAAVARHVRAERPACLVARAVATDEELRRVFADAEAPVRHSGEGFSAAERAGVAAVAARVRAERPACLVARAVALGCYVRLERDAEGWDVAVPPLPIAFSTRPADVPATLARLLDEVEFRVPMDLLEALISDAKKGGS